MKIIPVVLIVALFSNLAFGADCNFKTDIEKLPDGRFAYSSACHVKVGEMKRDLDTANAQVADYKQAITLKDLAISTSDKRVTLWQDTTFKLEDRVNAMDSLRTKNELLYFGLGIVVTGLSVWGASRLTR